MIFPYLSKEDERNNIQYDYSYIELTVKGPGNTKIYARDESNPACAGLTPPDEIQINNEESILKLN